MRTASTAIATILIAASICALTGCASTKNREILESRLTASEDKLLSAEQELVTARREIQSLQDALVVAREDAASVGKPIVVGPQPESLSFASLLTGGVDEDGQPGDEAVRVVIQPVADDGSTVRSEGRLDIELLDVAAPADRRVKGNWSYSGQKLREVWSTGLFSTGFQMELAPLDGVLPETALLIARLTTPEGKQLEAVHTVKLAPGSASRFVGQATEPPNDIVRVSAEAISADAPSVSRQPLSDDELKADTPSELPARVAPALDEEVAPGKPNPFESLMANPVRTSDAWTDESIPTLR